MLCNLVGYICFVVGCSSNGTIDNTRQMVYICDYYNKLRINVISQIGASSVQPFRAVITNASKHSARTNGRGLGRAGRVSMNG
jgi:hypothetical protein